jgi:hypothetical protein
LTEIKQKRMGNHCTKEIQTSDLVAEYNRCACQVDRYTDAYVDIMTNSNPKEIDFEEQQIIIAALIMGIKLSLIWETVYEQLVIPIMTPSLEQQGNSKKIFDKFEHDLSDIKAYFERFETWSETEKEKEKILNTTLRLAKLLKMFHIQRRRVVNPELVSKIQEEQRLSLQSHVVKRTEILSNLQFVSIDEFLKLNQARARSSNSHVVQPAF